MKRKMRKKGVLIFLADKCEEERKRKRQKQRKRRRKYIIFIVFLFKINNF